MNIYRVDRLDGEFLGLYRAKDSLEAIAKACQEFGDNSKFLDFSATIIYRDPEICHTVSRLRVRG
jgi:hypothetical protein